MRFSKLWFHSYQSNLLVVATDVATCFIQIGQLESVKKIGGVDLNKEGEFGGWGRNFEKIENLTISIPK